MHDVRILNKPLCQFLPVPVTKHFHTTYCEQRQYSVILILRKFVHNNFAESEYSKDVVI